MTTIDTLHMNPTNLATRYSDVTWAMAHDSHTAVINNPNFQSIGGGIQGIPVDQTQTIFYQLQGGIRAVRISTGISNKVVVLHHGTAKKFGRKFWNLSLYLSYIKAFLIANPTEIVTIIDEGSATDWDNDTDYETRLAGVYADVFGVAANSAPNLIFMPGSTKSDGTKFPTAQQLASGEPWPTLQELIDANQRLIVFMTNGYPQEPGHDWLLNAYGKGTTDSKGLMFSSNYKYYGNDLAHVGEYRPADVDTQLSVVAAGTAGPSRLYLFQHFIYHHEDDVFFSIDQGWQKYSKWTVGDLLVANVARTISQTGRIPNFINVDFYQGVFGARSYLIPLVKLLNEPATRSTSGAVQALTRGIHIQDTSEEDITAIANQRTTYQDQDLFIGGSYYIKKAGTEEYLTVDPIAPTQPGHQTTYGLALKAKSPTEHQTFTISYNITAPAPVVQPQGLALIHDFYQLAISGTLTDGVNVTFALQSPAALKEKGSVGVEIQWVDKHAWHIRPSGSPMTNFDALSDTTFSFINSLGSPTQWTFESAGTKIAEFMPGPPPVDYPRLTPAVLNLSGNVITATFSDTEGDASAYEAQLLIDGVVHGSSFQMVKASDGSGSFSAPFTVTDDTPGSAFQFQVRPAKTITWNNSINQITRLATPNLSNITFDGQIISVMLQSLTPNAQTYQAQLVLNGQPTGDIVTMGNYANNNRVAQFYTKDPTARIRVQATAPGYISSAWALSEQG